MPVMGSPAILLVAAVAAATWESTTLPALDSLPIPSTENVSNVFAANATNPATGETLNSCEGAL